MWNSRISGCPRNSGSRTSPSNSDAGGSVFCDGNGGFEPVIFPNKMGECVGDCALKHEQFHVQDFSIDAPSICRNKLRHYRVYYDNTSEQKFYESRAYKAELECLVDPQRCVGDNCFLKNLFRKEQVREQIVDFR